MVVMNIRFFNNMDIIAGCSIRDVASKWFGDSVITDAMEI